MKFVIKSLLFVNLILQMTTSLRKCFNQDQNLMLTIILLAFSLIGLIGIIIGNRFILIIFAACMTLILIASITIYAIGRSEKDELQPKVPYYINAPNQNNKDRERQDRTSGETSKIKSFVNKLLNKNQPSKDQKKKAKPKSARARNNNSTESLDQRINARSSFKSSVAAAKIMLSPTNDYDELEPLNAVQFIGNLPVARTSLAQQDVAITSGDDIKKVLLPGSEDLATKLDRISAMDRDVVDNGNEFGNENQVQSEQWVAYERHLYERYMNIVSQSIDLILHTILASWMALLLDEDSDKCFGNSHRRSKSKPSRAAKNGPVYNYNGVRYSIRPDTNDSPARVVVR